jgi:large subunit ribosomal protein L1
MSKLAKRVKANNSLVDKNKVYSLSEAVALAKQTANTKFVGSMEVHVRVGIDPKQTDQAVRGTASLPHGTPTKTAPASLASFSLASVTKATTRFNLPVPWGKLAVPEFATRTAP